MDEVRRDQAADIFASLWGKNMQEWNRSQHTVAAEVHKLFLETTTITESNLVKRVNRIIAENPEACGTNGNGESVKRSRYVLKHILVLILGR